jgi:hypothetical protein
VIVKSRIVLLVLMVLFAGCVGTEFVDDPVSPASQRLVITPMNSALQVGQSVQLQAMFSEGGSVSGAVWSSSDSMIVSVDGAGVATGVRLGQARITVQARGTTSEMALVNVVADVNQVARVEITPLNVARAIGGTQQFTATAYNLNNEVVTGRLVTWHSSDASVVEINANGFATALRAGSAAIVAMIDGIESPVATFTVSSNSRTGIFVMRPNSGHDVRGMATLTQQSNGSLVLTFGSNFASAGGPDVRVYLSQTNSVGANSLNLGRLKSYTGAQSYTVPSGVQLNTYDWVVIHCVPFNITFGYARLQ